MSAWAKQQTKETFRANQELASSIFNVSAEQAEKNRNEYKAEKVRKCKIRMINAWRAKQKQS